MSDDFEIYGDFEKDSIDELKEKIEDILDGKVNGEDEKLEVLKRIWRINYMIQSVSLTLNYREEKVTKRIEKGEEGLEDELEDCKKWRKFNLNKFEKRLRFYELFEKEEMLWERVKKFGSIGELESLKGD